MSLLYRTTEGRAQLREAVKTEVGVVLHQQDCLRVFAPLLSAEEHAARAAELEWQGHVAAMKHVMLAIFEMWGPQLTDEQWDAWESRGILADQTDERSRAIIDAWMRGEKEDQR